MIGSLPNGVVKNEPPLLQTIRLSKVFGGDDRALFRRTSRVVHAVNAVTLSVEEGQTVGLVGESGSGKSTFARLLVQLTAPSSGQILFDGDDITHPRRKELRSLRSRMQMVFQDPYSSFDPKATIGDSVSEPLRTHRLASNRSEERSRMAQLFDLVELPSSHLERFPAELSGGQLQRAAVARALAVEPKILVLDEPVSALDVSTQAVLINLLEDLQTELGISYLVIAHDLSVVRHMSHRIAVMYLGQIVEEGPADAVCDFPAHPYTQALLSAVPVPHPRRQRLRTRTVLRGDAPSQAVLPSGCPFHPRCPEAWDRCVAEVPTVQTSINGTTARCHLIESPRPLDAARRVGSG